MITREDFFKGRDKQYADQFNPLIEENAVETRRRANSLLEKLGFDSRTVNSGWRPPSVNAGVKNAAPNSRHMTGEAVDVHDPNRDLARACLQNLPALEEAELWMEDPRWTPTWCHWQTVPPGSKHRVFIPSTRPPLADPLPEQELT